MRHRDFRSWNFSEARIPPLWPVAIIVIALLIVFYLIRPLFHGIIIALYKSPLLVMFLCAIAVLGITNLLLKRKAYLFANKDTAKYRNVEKTNQALNFIIILFIISLIPLSLYSGYYMDKTLYENTDYLELDSLPETEVLRFLPYSVAQRYSLDAFTDPQYTLGDGDLVLQDGRMYWNFPMVPEGALLYYTKKPQGIISISADTSSKQVGTNFSEMQVGENIGITDNISWKVYKKDMFCDISDIYYQDDLIIVSVIKYKFKLIGRYPYFGGVYTIDYDGNMEFYSPEEAALMPWGNRIYPESLARKQIEVVNTKNGLLNMWIYHKEMIEIQDVYSGGNQQPFLLSTKEGMIWMTAVEPRGRSFGLYEIYFQDAITGKIYKYRVSEDNLTGPRYSIDYVKKTFPNFDWNSFYISEPRPVIKGDDLYWLVSIVPNDSAGVTKQCIVNARTSDVTSFDTDSDVLAFFEEGVVVPPSGQTTLEELVDRVNELENLVDELKRLLEEFSSQESE